MQPTPSQFLSPSIPLEVYNIFKSNIYIQIVHAFCDLNDKLGYIGCNIHASIFKELLKVAFKHFSQDFKNLRIDIFSGCLEVVEPISTTYNTL